jgi:hypothetical protein
MKALDTATKTTGKAHALKDLGYQAVGLYLRPDRADKAMVEDLHSAGIKCFSVYEKGWPTSPAYFKSIQGFVDGRRAAKVAAMLGQPKGTEIFAAVDYDAVWKTDGASVLAYMTAFRQEVKSAGYLASVYGSGLVCEKLVDAGYAHSGWLSGSTGWAGYKAFKARASVVQATMDIKILGLNADTDTVVDPGVCW